MGQAYRGPLTKKACSTSRGDNRRRRRVLMRVRPCASECPRVSRSVPVSSFLVIRSRNPHTRPNHNDWVTELHECSYTQEPRLWITPPRGGGLGLGSPDRGRRHCERLYADLPEVHGVPCRRGKRARQHLAVSLVRVHRGRVRGRASTRLSRYSHSRCNVRYFLFFGSPLRKPSMMSSDPEPTPSANSSPSSARSAANDP